MSAAFKDPIQSYRDLIVWQKSMGLVITCYSIARNFPSHEQYGLSSQLRRAAVSVPANIAEGHGRRSTREFLRHLSIAFGSLMELETHLLIAGSLEYSDAHALDEILQTTAEIGKMIRSLEKSLSRRLP